MQIDKNHNTVREHQRKKKKKKTRTRECQLQQGQFSTIQEDTQVLTRLKDKSLFQSIPVQVSQGATQMSDTPAVGSVI